MIDKDFLHVIKIEGNTYDIKYEDYPFLNTYTQSVTLDKLLDDDEIEKDYLNLITELSSKNRSELDEDTKLRYSLQYTLNRKTDICDKNLWYRRILSSFISTGNYIATHGRIGPPNVLVVSKKNYDLYFNKMPTAKEYFERTFKIYFTDKVVDAIVYRHYTKKTHYPTADNYYPGIALVHNDTHYKLVAFGNYPQYQFNVYELTDKRVLKLKRLLKWSN